MTNNTEVVRLFLEKHAAPGNSDDVIQDIANEVGKSRTFVEEILAPYGVKGLARHQRAALTVTPEVLDRLRDSLGQTRQGSQNPGGGGGKKPNV